MRKSYFLSFHINDHFSNHFSFKRFSGDAGDVEDGGSERVSLDAFVLEVFDE